MRALFGQIVAYNALVKLITRSRDQCWPLSNAAEVDHLTACLEWWESLYFVRNGDRTHASHTVCLIEAVHAEIYMVDESEERTKAELAKQIGMKNWDQNALYNLVARYNYNLPLRN